jgi:hypothetical protein
MSVQDLVMWPVLNFADVGRVYWNNHCYSLPESRYALSCDLCKSTKIRTYTYSGSITDTCVNCYIWIRRMNIIGRQCNGAIIKQVWPHSTCHHSKDCRNKSMWMAFSTRQSHIVCHECAVRDFK